MHAEVSIRFADDFRVDWLTAGLPASSDPRSVLELTHLRSSPDLLSSVVHARMETTFVYLVFREDAQSIRIHVEGRVAKGDLRQLARKSEHLSDSFVRAGVRHGVRHETASIWLYADEFLITSGTKRGFAERLIERFTETIFGDVMVGIFTAVFTGLISGEWGAAAVAGLASVLCFLGWLAIRIARGEDDAYEYARI